MKKVLILARHGNTFDEGEQPVWVGARTDLSLVTKGIAQAELIAESFIKHACKPDRIIAGPLKRTQEAAHIIAKTLQLNPSTVSTDERLREIDYGSWEGKSNDELKALGFETDIKAWSKESLFPMGQGWKPLEGQIAADVEFILADIANGLTLMVTSNGILKFFCDAALNRDAYTERKVATGHLCVMEQEPDGAWHIVEWNKPPLSIDLKG